MTHRPQKAGQGCLIFIFLPVNRVSMPSPRKRSGFSSNCNCTSAKITLLQHNPQAMQSCSGKENILSIPQSVTFPYRSINLLFLAYETALYLNAITFFNH